MRNKLIDDLNSALKDQFDYVPLDKTIKIADELLAKGFISVPEKSVYRIVDKGTPFAMVMPKSVDSLTLYELKDLSKYGYYISRDAAEQALKEQQTSLSDKLSDAEERSGAAAGKGAEREEDKDWLEAYRDSL